MKIAFDRLRSQASNSKDAENPPYFVKFIQEIESFERDLDTYCGSTTLPQRPSNFKGVIGVCALDVKARSKSSTNILNRLNAKAEFEVVTFGDKVILDEGKHPTLTSCALFTYSRS